MAVAPVAEWVAQALWNSHNRSSTAEQLPTRLTHRRRSEGRGNNFSVRTAAAPRQVKICEVCGAEGVKNHYCRSCAVDASREVMAQVALLGHSKPKSARVKARISKKLSDHAVANTWWSPSNQPARLNKEFYVQKIQPQLKSLSVREIAQAMQVSRPYAAFIRAGKRMPHPRHWQALAELVEVSH